MKFELPEAIRNIPFHFTGFLVLMLAGMIRIIYDGNSKFRMMVKSIVLLLLLGTLISILTSVFELHTKWVVTIMAVFGYLSGFLLNALLNIGKRIETESPNWFEKLVEGIIKKKLETYETRAEIEESRNDKISE